MVSIIHSITMSVIFIAVSNNTNCHLKSFARLGDTSVILATQVVSAMNQTVSSSPAWDTEQSKGQLTQFSETYLKM